MRSAVALANVVVEGSCLKLEDLVKMAGLGYPVKLSDEAVDPLGLSFRNFYPVVEAEVQLLI